MGTAALAYLPTPRPRRRSAHPVVKSRRLRLVVDRLFQDVGDRLYALRESLDVTQASFAEDCDIGKSTVSAIECGHHVPQGRTLYKIARGLGVSADYLLNLSDRRDLR